MPALCRGREQSLDVTGLAHVCAHGRSLAAASLDAGSHAGKRGGVAGREHDVRAGCGQGRRGGSADAAAGACHYRQPSGQPVRSVTR